VDCSLRPREENVSDLGWARLSRVTTMKVAEIRKLCANSAALFGSGEPVLVTKHGKVSGIYVPLDEADRLPDALRCELAVVLARHLAELLERKEVTEKEITEDFDAYRRRRR
jgi:PHD/YefM family antitoxin component YafN of YafNO toxin-antitoxin module